MAIGMKINNKSDFNCGICTMAKQTNRISKVPDVRAKVSMELVHSDLAGPIDPVARDGFSYAITFTDDYSGAIFVYFLKVKSDASKALVQFLADASPYGKISRLRSDNGGEFTSGHFKEILLKNGIKHEFTAPYSPHRNGTAERGWRTLFEMGRILLLESGLPKTFWTYAVMAAAFTRNRCYNQRIKETPFYLLTGKRPNVSKLHVFGTTCYALEQNVKKLDPRGRKGIFIGYDKNSPAYLIYFKDDDTVSRRRVVEFTERLDNTHDKKVIEPRPESVVHEENDIFDDEVKSETCNDETPPPDVAARRYPLRDRKKPEFLNYSCYNRDMDCNVDCLYKVTPKSYNEAIKSNESSLWQKAMDVEISS